MTPIDIVDCAARLGYDFEIAQAAIETLEQDTADGVADYWEDDPARILKATEESMIERPTGTLLETTKRA